MKYNYNATAVYNFYNGNYKKYGYSEKSLAWNKGKQNIRFEQLTKNLALTGGMKIFDVGSGIINFRMHEVDNYKNFHDVLEKALSICKSDGAVAIDVQSDKVDYIANDIVFHNSPEKVLGIAYDFSRNVILDNSCMPFEFSLVIYKDDS